MDPSLLPFVQVSVSWASEHRWRPGTELTGQQVSQHALWLVLEGAVTVRVAGREDSVSGGMACLSPANAVRDIAAPNGAHLLSAGLSASLFGRIDVFQTLVGVVAWRPAPSDRDALQTWIRQLADEWVEVVPAANAADPRYRVLGYPKQPRGPVSALIGEGLGRALFGLCWRALQGEPLTRGGGVPVGGPAWLSRTLQHVAREPGTPVHELAEVAALSPAQFRRAFHGWVGVSPQTYVTRARLDEARRLLLTTDLIVAVVAERVGFASLSYFTRLFKRQFGLSPAQYRQLGRQPAA